MEGRTCVPSEGVDKYVWETEEEQEEERGWNA